MWSNLLYMAPVINILSECIIAEDVKMEGDLAEEMQRVFNQYLNGARLQLNMKSIKARVHATYPTGTSLWSILDGIMACFQLIAYVDVTAWGDVLLQLREGASWKH